MPKRLQLKRALWSASFFGFCLLPLALQADCAPENIDAEVRVTKVFDGDTVLLHDGRHLRFIGINTPERARQEKAAEPLAETATRRLKTLLKASRNSLRLRYGTVRQDHYGRLLAHPFLTDGRNLTELLLQEGLGARIVIPPNLWGQDCYRKAEQSARGQHRGLWNIPYFRPRRSGTLTPDTTGFRRVTGSVSRIGESRSALWLNLGRGFALRLPKKDLHYFTSPPRQLAGKTLTVRGWVYYVENKHELRMNLRHPGMIEAVSP